MARGDGRAWLGHAYLAERAREADLFQLHYAEKKSLLE